MSFGGAPSPFARTMPTQATQPPHTIPVQMAYPPVGLKVGEEVDFVMIVPRKVAFLVVIFAGLVLTVLATVYCVLYYSPLALAGVIVAFAITLLLGYFTTEIRAEFRKVPKEFVYVRRRLLLQPCGYTQEIAHSMFEDLPLPYIKADATSVRKSKKKAQTCHIFLPHDGVKNGRLPLAIEKFESVTEKEAAILGWQYYIRQLKASGGDMEDTRV